MTIDYAILGILSCREMAGYDLKKMIQKLPFMYWSGNNNQIYKSLVELHDKGFVTIEVQYQESLPAKKIYTITEEGLAELKKWVLTTPEPPEFKKMFLIQFAWADRLNEEELNTLLTGYEKELTNQLLMQQELKRRKPYSPDRTVREEKLWNLIYDNLISSYENELNWVQKVRREINLLGKDGKL
jgi:DNA-binding PadR family transcriptional regulator